MPFQEKKKPVLKIEFYLAKDGFYLFHIGK